MSDTIRTLNPFEQTYLDKVQAEFPALAGEEARQALAHVYLAVYEGSREFCAQRIFEHVRDLCIADLDLLKNSDFNEAAKKAFATDLHTTLHDFLNRTYSSLLQNVALAGGLTITVTQPPPPPIEVQEEDELSEEDKLLIRGKTRGDA